MEPNIVWNTFPAGWVIMYGEMCYDCPHVTGYGPNVKAGAVVKAYNFDYRPVRVRMLTDKLFDKFGKEV